MKSKIDARNTLGVWSLIKWIIDIIIILSGGGILAELPNVMIFSLVFILWLWSLIKLIGDTPIVLLWLLGKIQHRLYKKHKRKKK